MGVRRHVCYCPYHAPLRIYCTLFVLLALPLFHPNFGVFPLHLITQVWVSVSRCLKVFGCETEIIFEVFQPV